MRRQRRRRDNAAARWQEGGKKNKKSRERRGWRASQGEVRQSEKGREKMEAIAGPVAEIKAVLHEINGGPHRRYMNHGLLQ